MHFRIEVIAVAEDGTECRQELVPLTRTAAKLETIGLTLAESKQVLQQCARGLPVQTAKSIRDLASAEDASREHPLEAEEASLERQLESVKHYLWHGNSRTALERLNWLVEDLESWDYDADGAPQPQPGRAGAARMLKYVRELETYISNNAGSIVNYGERYRNGERISTGFVESTINGVISKRMVKKQQMQWTPEGATCCYKCALRCSMRSGRRHSAPGIPRSG